MSPNEFCGKASRVKVEKNTWSSGIVEMAKQSLVILNQTERERTVLLSGLGIVVIVFFMGPLFIDIRAEEPALQKLQIMMLPSSLLALTLLRGFSILAHDRRLRRINRLGLTDEVIASIETLAQAVGKDVVSLLGTSSETIMELVSNRLSYDAGVVISYDRILADRTHHREVRAHTKDGKRAVSRRMDDLISVLVCFGFIDNRKETKTTIRSRAFGQARAAATNPSNET